MFIVLYFSFRNLYFLLYRRINIAVSFILKKWAEIKQYFTEPIPVVENEEKLPEKPKPIKKKMKPKQTIEKQKSIESPIQTPRFRETGHERTDDQNKNLADFHDNKYFNQKPLKISPQNYDIDDIRKQINQDLKTSLKISPQYYDIDDMRRQKWKLERVGQNQTLYRQNIKIHDKK